MSLLDREVARHDPFSRVLFYSVLLHYAIFFLLFGNPFLLLNDEEGFETGRSMEVRLLSPPTEEKPPEALRIPFPTASAEEQAARENLALTRDIGAGDEARALTPPAFASDAISDLKAPKAPTPSATPPAGLPKTAVRKLPPNMTGPEDCLLKVVGMVCPSGTAECIEAYKDFCASLPE